jgi:hypothetical protein
MKDSGRLESLEPEFASAVNGLSKEQKAAVVRALCERLVVEVGLDQEAGAKALVGVAAPADVRLDWSRKFERMAEQLDEQYFDMSREESAPIRPDAETYFRKARAAASLRYLFSDGCGALGDAVYEAKAALDGVGDLAQIIREALGASRGAPT